MNYAVWENVAAFKAAFENTDLQRQIESNWYPASAWETDMMRRIHGFAGVVGFGMILIFWTSTAISELFGSYADIAMVKTNIVWDMLILIAALAITGGSGMWMGRARKGMLIDRKKKRMPVIPMNGLLILVPSGFFLANKANNGVFDTWFYGVQSIELIAGAVNMCLMGLNIRDA